MNLKTTKQKQRKFHMDRSTFYVNGYENWLFVCFGGFCRRINSTSCNSEDAFESVNYNNSRMKHVGIILNCWHVDVNVNCGYVGISVNYWPLLFAFYDMTQPCPQLRSAWQTGAAVVLHLKCYEMNVTWHNLRRSPINRSDT